MDNTTMHRQWASRPADERFATLAEMYAALRAEAAQCGKSILGTERITVVPTNHGGNGLALMGPSGQPAMLTHWSMSQISAIAKAPASYLRTLPAEIAARALNHSMSVQPREDHQLYLRNDAPSANGHVLTTGNGTAWSTQLTLRAITSPGYARIHTAKIVARLMELQEQRPSLKAPQVYKDGDWYADKAPCVGFAGDRDAYVWLIDEEQRIADPTDKTGQGLARGIMVLNSEVGSKKLDLIMFLCRFVCGNFIIWGYQQIPQISLRHFGDKIRREWSAGIGNAFSDYARLSAREEESKIQHAIVHQLGAKQDDVIDLLFRTKIVTKEQATDAYQLAERYDDNPRSSWGMVQGITRLSQTRKNMDDRIELDRAAARIMEF